MITERILSASEF